eukprot:scaffold107_cov154-Amphora_coffeaeformis.AAC.2
MDDESVRSVLFHRGESPFPTDLPNVSTTNLSKTRFYQRSNNATQSPTVAAPPSSRSASRSTIFRLVRINKSASVYAHLSKSSRSVASFNHHSSAATGGLFSATDSRRSKKPSASRGSLMIHTGNWALSAATGAMSHTNRRIIPLDDKSESRSSESRLSTAKTEASSALLRKAKQGRPNEYAVKSAAASHKASRRGSIVTRRVNPRTT